MGHIHPRENSVLFDTPYVFISLKTAVNIFTISTAWFCSCSLIWCVSWCSCSIFHSSDGIPSMPAAFPSANFLEPHGLLLSKVVVTVFGYLLVALFLRYY